MTNTAPGVVRTMCPMHCHPTLCGMLVEVEDGRARDGGGGALGRGHSRVNFSEFDDVWKAFLGTPLPRTTVERVWSPLAS